MNSACREGKRTEWHRTVEWIAGPLLEPASAGCYHGFIRCLTHWCPPTLDDVPGCDLSAIVAGTSKP